MFVVIVRLSLKPMQTSGTIGIIGLDTRYWFRCWLVAIVSRITVTVYCCLFSPTCRKLHIKNYNITTFQDPWCIWATVDRVLNDVKLFFNDCCAISNCSKCTKLVYLCILLNILMSNFAARLFNFDFWGACALRPLAPPFRRHARQPSFITVMAKGSWWW